MSVLQSTQDGVRTTTDGSILEVTLDRPKANAIDLAASRRLNAIFTAFRDDAALRIAIITGSGEKFFSPGWDLKGAAQGEPSDSDWGVGGFGGLNYPRNLDKPIIAVQKVVRSDDLKEGARAFSARRRPVLKGQ